MTAVSPHAEIGLDIDPITGRYGREGFFQAARELVDAHPGRRFLLVRGDTDRFKVFNDLHGVQVGDQLLYDFGEMLRDLMPEPSVIGRLRGDHFVVCVAADVFDPQHALQTVDEWLAGYPISHTYIARMGVYEIEDPSLDMAIVCDRALLALNRAKRDTSGKRCWRYDDDLRMQVILEQEYLDFLSEGLESGQFVLYLQPQFSYTTRAMVGAEALVRWNHPTRGMLLPDEFIPVFEHSGHITQVDYYVWEQACKLLSRWRRSDSDAAPRHVSVNVSRVSLHDNRTMGSLCALMDKYDLPPSALHLEITETAYMEAPELLIETLKQLQDKGFVVEMDDFGSGYSSLNTLKDVPVDVLKLDMGFLDNDSKLRGGIVLASVVRMARLLDVPVLAEGVEHKEQALYLESIGCEYMQGHLFSAPLSVLDFEELAASMRFESMVAPGANSRDRLALHGTSMADIVNALPVGVAAFELHDREFYPLHVNETVCDMLGESYEYYLKRIGRSLGEHYRNELLTLVQWSDDGEPLDGLTETQREITARNGTPITVRAQGRLFREGDQPVLYVLLFDVTHEVQEQRERIWLDERYRLLSELTDTISFDFDSATGAVQLYVDAGQGVEQQVLENYESAVDMRRGVIHPDSIEALRSLVSGLGGSEYPTSIEYQANYDGKGYQWYRAEIFLVDDSAGIAHTVGLIKSIQQEHDLRTQANTDAVTGLSNHSSAMQQIDELLADPETRLGNVCLAFDIDDFKEVNDTYGHIVGDMLLAEVGRVVRECVRESDIFGRVGGDEFVVLLRHMTVEGALRKVECLREGIIAIELPDAPGLGVRASAGLTATTRSDTCYRDVFGRADKALYEAKDQGKDRVTVC